MARMRSAKKRYKKWLTSPNWRDHLQEIAQDGKESIGPLFSFLLLDPLTRHRAAIALGASTARLAEKEADAAHNIMRRLMWHMNEESGNIGWGIPEAFAEILVANEALAKGFHRILCSYIMDLKHDDNYCDYPILRRSCYWAVGRLAQQRPELCLHVRPWLVKGLNDEDRVCQGMAAWALGQLPPDIMDIPALRKLASTPDTPECEIFDGEILRSMSAAQLAAQVLQKKHTLPK
jgi:hypothetical protein